MTNIPGRNDDDKPVIRGSREGPVPVHLLYSTVFLSCYSLTTKLDWNITSDCVSFKLVSSTLRPPM